MENQNFISANKIGTRVNLNINGEMHSKDFIENELAIKFFNLILDVKKNPTDFNIKKVLESLNKKLAIKKIDGILFYPETNQYFMEGFEHTPLPDLLLNTMIDYLENGFDIKSIKNFWKLLMANPDPNVRNDLFHFIANHDFSLTDEGYMWVYKRVGYYDQVKVDLATFVSNQYLKVRKDWKCSPNKYVVYQEFENEDRENFVYKITKKVTADKWDLSEKNIEICGLLGDLQSKIDELIDADQSTIFTDLHTGTMKIRLGVPVVKSREECDGDPKRDCSYGLHVGATKYVETFSNNNDNPVLVCLVNPMNVVAVPNYDHSKMRVCEYFPVAVATFEDNKIDIIKQSYFPYDYVSHEEEQLQKMLSENFEGVPSAMNVNNDDRAIEDYVRILESRMSDISTMYEE